MQKSVKSGEAPFSESGLQPDVLKYMQDSFPDFRGDISIRFELGEPFDNGTDERIRQVVFRVTTLFEKTFSQNDNIHLLIKDWTTQADAIPGNAYLYVLLNHLRFYETVIYENDETEDEAGKTMKEEIPCKIRTLTGALSSIPYKDILIGLANNEQGRKPSIAQQVYFINIEKNIVFYMYDDRGCVIYAKEKERLRNLYADYNDWLVDFKA